MYTKNGILTGTSGTKRNLLRPLKGWRTWGENLFRFLKGGGSVKV